VPSLTDIEGIAQRLFALKRFVLMIGDTGALIARLSGSRIVSHQFLTGTIEENIRQAKLALSEFPKYPVVMLYDVLGQTYRRDRLPPVSLLDRPKILARKLDSLFPGAELKGGMQLGRSTGEIRGFDYLFASIAASPEITEWQSVLSQIENPTCDIRLLPVESVKLLQQIMHAGNGKLSKPNPWNILITHHRTGGFRQIVTRDGGLAIARMTASSAAIESPAEIAGLLRREIGATIDYITRLGFDRTAGLDAIFIGRSDISAALKNVQLPVRKLTVYTPAEAESLAGISGARDDSGHFADLLHAAWGASRIIPALSVWALNLRQARSRVLGYVWGARALAAASLAAILYSANIYWEIQRTEAEYLQLESTRAALQQRYDEEVSKLDSGPMPIARMRDIIAIHAQLQNADIDLNSLYTVINSALSGNVRLHALDIEIDPPELALAPVQDPPLPADESAETPPVEVGIVLNLDLSSFRDAELAIAEADRMIQALRLALPGMKIKILRQPLRILPEETLTVKPGENVLTISGEDRIAKIELTGRLK